MPSPLHNWSPSSDEEAEAIRSLLASKRARVSHFGRLDVMNPSSHETGPGPFSGFEIPQPLIYDLGTEIYSGNMGYRDAAAVLQSKNKGLTENKAIEKLRSVVLDMLGPDQRLSTNDPREYKER